MAKKKTTKKSTKKSTPKKKVAKAKDINVVVPVPTPTDLTLIDRLKNIKDKVFSTFGFDHNSPNG